MREIAERAVALTLDLGGSVERGTWVRDGSFGMVGRHMEGNRWAVPSDQECCRSVRNS